MHTPLQPFHQQWVRFEPIADERIQLRWKARVRAPGTEGEREPTQMSI